MGNRVQLLSLDFGSTTSCAMVVQADVEKNSHTGKMRLSNAQVIYKSEPVFTPIVNNIIDADAVEAMLDDWLLLSGLEAQNIFSGGAIFTGLTAQRKNVNAVAEVVRRFIGDGLLHAVDDPNLESWLAYRGNLAYLHNAQSDDSLVLNLDIGGGTTNPAIGVGELVLATGCYYVGARHFEFVPGGYKLVQFSEVGGLTLQHLKMRYKPGDVMAKEDVNRIADFYVEQLVKIKNHQLVCDFLIQVDLNVDSLREGNDRPSQQGALIDNAAKPIQVLLSGGIGEIYYNFLRSGHFPETTAFGDLGVDIVKAIVRSDLLESTVCLPKESGRATAYGLALFNTQLSGTTIFVNGKCLLPLNDVPVIGAIKFQQLFFSNKGLKKIIEMQVKVGGALHLDFTGSSYSSLSSTEKIKAIKGIALQLRDMINHVCAKTEGLSNSKSKHSKDSADEVLNVKPLVYFMDKDIALTFGNYMSHWRQWEYPIIVIDEVPLAGADYVNIGVVRHNLVPVSFYGLHALNT